MGNRQFTSEEAKTIGDQLGVDWNKIPIDEFRMGLSVELEHGANAAETNLTDDDLIATGKIALAHLKEFADYYTRLGKMEAEADDYWSKKK
ncbi:DUF5661 family protein [Planctomycetes bacterium TBK1r]|uniref:Uncharacterized protein n=1 Tax=Stieleria magnilauensis TaxID=2527963 RepID=A0ABX5XIS7_9BACT|nr:hypothetical protein TBK1r_08060 [Planctomycetes bacterium TBK1r]